MKYVQFIVLLVFLWLLRRLSRSKCSLWPPDQLLIPLNSFNETSCSEASTHLFNTHTPPVESLWLFRLQANRISQIRSFELTVRSVSDQIIFVCPDTTSLSAWVAMVTT